MDVKAVAVAAVTMTERCCSGGGSEYCCSVGRFHRCWSSELVTAAAVVMVDGADCTGGNGWLLLQW